VVLTINGGNNPPPLRTINRAIGSKSDKGLKKKKKKRDKYSPMHQFFKPILRKEVVPIITNEGGFMTRPSTMTLDGISDGIFLSINPPSLGASRTPSTDSAGEDGGGYCISILKEQGEKSIGGNDDAASTDDNLSTVANFGETGDDDEPVNPRKLFRMDLTDLIVGGDKELYVETAEKRKKQQRKEKEDKFDSETLAECQKRLRRLIKNDDTELPPSSCEENKTTKKRKETSNKKKSNLVENSGDCTYSLNDDSELADIDKSVCVVQSNEKSKSKMGDSEKRGKRKRANVSETDIGANLGGGDVSLPSENKGERGKRKESRRIVCDEVTKPKRSHKKKLKLDTSVELAKRGQERGNDLDGGDVALLNEDTVKGDKNLKQNLKKISNGKLKKSHKKMFKVTRAGETSTIEHHRSDENMETDEIAIPDKNGAEACRTKRKPKPNAKNILDLKVVKSLKSQKMGRDGKRKVNAKLNTLKAFIKRKNPEANAAAEKKKAKRDLTLVSNSVVNVAVENRGVGSKIKRVGNIRLEAQKDDNITVAKMSNPKKISDKARKIKRTKKDDSNLTIASSSKLRGEVSTINRPKTAAVPKDRGIRVKVKGKKNLSSGANTSVCNYFGSLSRLSNGVGCRVIGRRVTVDGKVQYLVEWDGGIIV